jgi:hypothetical protein
MKNKPPPKKKNNARASKKAPAAKKAAPPFGKRPKAKIPALGSGMVGLGGTGSQGMMP